MKTRFTSKYSLRPVFGLEIFVSRSSWKTRFLDCISLSLSLWPGSETTAEYSLFTIFQWNEKHLLYVVHIWSSMWSSAVATESVVHVTIRRLIPSRALALKLSFVVEMGIHGPVQLWRTLLHLCIFLSVQTAQSTLICKYCTFSLMWCFSSLQSYFHGAKPSLTGCLCSLGESSVKDVPMICA